MTVKEWLASINDCDHLDLWCSECPRKDTCKANSISGYTFEEVFRSGILTLDEEN